MAKNDSKDLDSFWDISDLVPRKKQSYGVARSTSTVYIESDSNEKSTAKGGEAESSTIIKRYIPPYNGSEKLSDSKKYVSIEEYVPQSTLLHKVTVKRVDPAFTYYAGFLDDAKKYMDARGEPCDYVQFFSYVPQYDQLNKAQLSYYLWFRENERQGIHMKTDYGYLFLYIYELINLGDMLDVKRSQYILTEMWNTYHSTFPALATKLATWIIDFSLVHHLMAPSNAHKDIIQGVTILKEFYINMPQGDANGCARSLMKYCSSYDFRTSKFYKSDTAELFEKHVYGALVKAVELYSAQGGILSKFDFGDSTVERDAYAGAVCVHSQKYRLEIGYCSFSRSNELRFIIGDMIKYAENKIRAYLGVKSRISVYSVTPEMRKYLDEYFISALPSKKAVKAKKEKNDYDVLYDIPAKKLSLTDAARIEEESWQTTRELIVAFDDSSDENSKEDSLQSDLPESQAADLPLCDALSELETEFSEENSVSVLAQFGERSQVILGLLNGERDAISKYAFLQGKMQDAVVDEINEISIGIIGDYIIEDDGTGRYGIVEDYRELLK